MDLVGTVFAVFATLALLVSAGAIVWHRHIITRWKAVDAMILGEEIAHEAHLSEDTGRGRLFEGIAQSRVGRRLGRDDAAVHAGLIHENVRRIEYRYRHDGRWYTSTSLGLGNTRERVRHLELFPVGRTVTARVNPADPSHSILLWRPAFRSYAGALFALWLLSVIASADLHEIPQPDWVTLPESWTVQVAAWWLLGIVAIAHFVRLGGQFTRGAVMTAAVYFGFASSPHLLPWAMDNLWPPIARRIPPHLPEGGMETVALYALGGLLVAGGTLLVLLIVWSVVATLVDAYRFHRSFVPVDATITLSEIRKEVRGSASGKSSPYWWYWPEIRFEYQVVGRRHDTGVYAPSTTYGGARGGITPAMQAIVDGHPVGSTHRARHDPKRPQVAWLVSDTLGQHLEGLVRIAGWLVVLPMVLFYLVVLFGG
jgi:hypothetical protein